VCEQVQGHETLLCKVCNLEVNQDMPIVDANDTREDS